MVFYVANNLSVIWQKGESQNGGNKQKARQISEKQTFLTPWHVHVWIFADIILKTVKTSKNLFYLMITFPLSIFDTEIDEKVYAYLRRIN